MGHVARSVFALVVALGPGVGATDACSDQKKIDADRANAEAASARAKAEATLAANGGDPLGADARQEFEKTWSCPTERVTVKLRTDIDVFQATHTPKKPPDEVKNDPARLAKWTADQDAELAQQRAHDKEHRIFEINGCGHTELQDCRPHHKGSAVYPDWADCNPMTAPRSPIDASSPPKP